MIAARSSNLFFEPGTSNPKPYVVSMGLRRRELEEKAASVNLHKARSRGLCWQRVGVGAWRLMLRINSGPTSGFSRYSTQLPGFSLTDAREIECGRSAGSGQRSQGRDFPAIFRRRFLVCGIQVTTICQFQFCLLVPKQQQSRVRLCYCSWGLGSMFGQLEND